MSLTELRGVPGKVEPPVTINPITKEPTKYYDYADIYGEKGGLVHYTTPKKDLYGQMFRYKLRHKF